MPAGVQAERPRLPRQLHARFFRRAAPFAVVARMAAGHQVLPGGFARARARHYMVQRQLRRRQRPQTILARVAVAHQNVLAREGARLVRDAAVFEQPDHRRQAHAAPRRMHRVRGFLLRRRRHALQHQHQRAPRRADVDRLIARVQDQHRFLQPAGDGHLRKPPSSWKPRWKLTSNSLVWHRAPDLRAAGPPAQAQAASPISPPRASAPARTPMPSHRWS